MNLEVKNLTVQREEKTILHQISLSFSQGKNYCILGKNGSGKSSLVSTIMGHPFYTVTEGEILLDNEDITNLSPDERAKRGIFLAFQNVPEIPGLKLFEFLKEIYDQKNGTTTFLSFKKLIEPILEELKISKEFLRRELNVGFSGGEKRKIEILQMRLLKPKFIILDEIDSGLDIDACKLISEMLGAENTQENSFIIITHTFSLLEHLPIDTVYVIKEGEKEKEA
ncbi:Fe-S cluster assembly ATPase SufC [bacterium]|nr:Fe-S cluster assembly ATPase SufC [bacterium]